MNPFLQVKISISVPWIWILAFHQRGENKNAYDLYFVIRNYGSGIDEVCECLSPLLKETETKKALEILSRDFVDPDGLGPSRVALFQYNEPNPDLQVVTS